MVVKGGKAKAISNDPRYKTVSTEEAQVLTKHYKKLPIIKCYF